MKFKLIMLLAAMLVSCGLVQAADSVGVVVYDKTEGAVVTAGSNVPVGHALELQISIASDTAMGGISLGFDFSSVDAGLTTTWDAQTGGHGTSTAVTVVPGSRMDPVSGTIDLFVITEQDLDGTLPDSILIGGAAILGAGLDAGPYEHMYSIHFTPGGVPEGESKEMCIDSSFVPPAGEFLFVSLPSGLTWPPGFSGEFCFNVVGGVGVDGDNAAVPLSYNLKQNFPNPFNPVTTIAYGIERKDHVNLSIYNILGQRVKTLVNEDQEANSYEAIWNGDDEEGSQVASGIYFYKITAGDFVETRKMVLMR